MADPGKIGIMADSHGATDTIAAAIRLFEAAGCERMIHLGDICDSVNSDQADECVRLLHAHAVLAIKGNNDHAVVKNRTLRENGRISGETADYLAALPLQIEMAGAHFVHSRPFAERLGLSAMTGDIGTREAARFQAAYPGRILFRGHGHSPVAARLGGNGNQSVMPFQGDSLSLDGQAGWIVTCGALYKGFCMTWTYPTSTITSHRLAV